MKSILAAPVLVASLFQGLASAQACATTLTANYPAPSVAPGLVARLVANGLKSPRGIQFDNRGALLVVEEGKGISALNLHDAGNNCISVTSKKLVIDDSSLNHGIQLSSDGDTLYASSGSTAYSWQYDPVKQTNSTAPKMLVTGMAGTDHTSRTLMLSTHAPGMLVVNRGSFANLDATALNKSSGHAQVKAFNITGISKPYDFDTQGKLLAWGVRNDVGIREHPITGGIYTVENSADQISRDGQDVHQNNPAEEMNFLGYLNGTASPNQGRNFGYPTCFTAWNASELPNFKGTTGDAFALGDNANDNLCTPAAHQLSRLAFQAHMAPLDILFNTAGNLAFITFHGSFDRVGNVGYQVAVVRFANGEPVAPRTSMTAAIPIFRNADISKCPKSCFRPVGLSWDAKGRLFMSSDLTGEIYAIASADRSSIMEVGGTTANASTPDNTPDTESKPSSSISSSSSPSDAAATMTTTGSAVGRGTFSRTGILATFFAWFAFVL